MSGAVQNNTCIEASFVKLHELSEDAFSHVKDCYLFMSIAYIQLDQFESSLDVSTVLLSVLRKVDASSFDIAHAIVVQAKAKELQGNTSEAVEALDEALSLLPGDQRIVHQMNLLRSSYNLKQIGGGLHASNQDILIGPK